MDKELSDYERGRIDGVKAMAKLVTGYYESLNNTTSSGVVIYTVKILAKERFGVEIEEKR